MQDAVRDFGLSASEQIENMPDGSLSAGWTNVSPWIDTAASALTVAWPPSAVAVAVAGVLKGASETWVTERSADDAEALKNEFEGGDARDGNQRRNHFARAFSEAQQAAYATLNFQRLKDPVVRRLIQLGGPEEVEALISVTSRCRRPTNVDTYTKICMKLEQDFAEERIKTVLTASAAGPTVPRR